VGFFWIVKPKLNKIVASAPLSNRFGFAQLGASASLGNQLSEAEALSKAKPKHPVEQNRGWLPSVAESVAERSRSCC